VITFTSISDDALEELKKAVPALAKEGAIER
jgi:hypothetical protein